MGPSPSFRLGLGGAFHPSTKRKPGFAGEVMVGATTWFEDPDFTLWPELGISFGTSEQRGAIAGVAQLGVGYFGLLYYHLGFEGGLSFKNGIFGGFG